MPAAVRARLRRATARVLAAALLAAAPAAQAGPRYPGRSWKAAPAERLGWSREKLRAAEEYAGRIPTAAVMIVVGGQVVAGWGQTAARYNVHSIRKSLLSALYGIHVGAGRIDPSRTLEQLGIDDNAPSLTPAEKQATIADLLQARSGVYHPALYETSRMAELRPARGSHAPGTFWYYNNWDFNALGTILERHARNSIFREFQERIATPLQMEDFRLADGEYVTGADSVYPAYPFRMTARDLARFGLLILRRGEWNGRRLIPAEWVEESTRPHSQAGDSGGYGYMWWVAVQGRHLPGVVLPDGSFSARGAGGHYVLIVPALDLVLVHRVDTDVPGRAVSAEQFGELVRLVLAARR